MLAEAMLELCRARVMLLFPFAWIERALGTRMSATPTQVEPTDLTQLDPIAWAIRASAAHTPFRATCFVTAITAQRILRRRGIPAVLHLGVRKAGASSELEAHAWVTAGDRILTGADECADYTVVAAYSLNSGSGEDRADSSAGPVAP